MFTVRICEVGPRGGEKAVTKHVFDNYENASAAMDQFEDNEFMSHLKIELIDESYFNSSAI